jgi:Skp family chaperone for outer membrane proteins
MNLKTLIPLSLLCGLALPAAFAHAQGSNVRIAVVDAARVFNEMQETKDTQAQMQEERNRLEAVGKEKADELNKLKAQRDQLKPGAPGYEEMTDKLNDSYNDFQAWRASAQAKGERNQKRQVATLFQKLEAATSQVAQSQGYDLVLAKQQPQLPENLDAVKYEQVVQILSARNVLYAAPRADISNDVIQVLNTNYKGRGGAATAAPRPAAPATGTGGVAPAPAAPGAAPRSPAPAPAPAPRK